MALVNNLIKQFKDLCKDDDLCIILVGIFLLAAFYYMFSDEVSGYINFAPFDGASGDSEGGSDHGLGRQVGSGRRVDLGGTPGYGGQAGPNVLPQGQQVQQGQHMPQMPQMPQMPGRDSGHGIGIELNKRRPDPTPSTTRQLAMMDAKKPVVDSAPIGSQMAGVMVQDSMMFRPFDEVWNPGFMPIDMVFKGTGGQPAVGPMPPRGPQPGPQHGPQPGPGRGAGGAGGGGGGGAGGELKIVLLYAPWCGHSKKMLPDYDKVKAEFDGRTINGNRISIIMYDSDVDKDKVKEYGVKGFPTLFVEKNGVKEPFPHRSYAKIAEYINSA